MMNLQPAFLENEMIYPNRYKRDVFAVYFRGAMDSKGAFLVMDKQKNIIGCSRYYDYDANEKSVLIGYTFLAKHCWGHTYNKALKMLMLDYIFRFVDVVKFHVGEHNLRSQKAIERLGAIKTNTLNVAYVGELPQQNFEYSISKTLFLTVIRPAA
jgi:N-acetyltransferase